jgi:pimeloyl-ACP methyl ester carboxylesterase
MQAPFLFFFVCSCFWCRNNKMKTTIVFILLWITIAKSIAVQRSRVRVKLPGEDNVILHVIIDKPNQDENGETIVIWPSSLRGSDTDYDPVAERIALAGYRVLRPQPRGIDGSHGPMDNLTLHTLADDVAAVIRELAGSGGRAVVVGHAYGHFVARVTDLDYPELLRGVVIAAAAQRSPSDPKLIAALNNIADGTLSREERLALLNYAFFAPGNNATAWLDGWYPSLRDVYVNASRMPPKDVWWSVSNAPILDLQAAEDPWRPRNTSQELRDTLGSGKVTVTTIEHASHALFTEQPEQVADAIIAWVNALPSSVSDYTNKCSNGILMLWIFVFAYLPQILRL